MEQNIEYYRVEEEAFDDPKYGKLLDRKIWQTSTWCIALVYGEDNNGVSFAILKYPSKHIGATLVPRKYLKPRNWYDKSNYLLYHAHHLKCLWCGSCPLSRYDSSLYCSDKQHHFDCTVRYQPWEEKMELTCEITALGILQFSFDSKKQMLNVVQSGEEPENIPCQNYDDAKRLIVAVSGRYKNLLAFL